MHGTAAGNAFRWYFALLILSFSFVIAGCGGSSDNDDDGPTATALEVSPSQDTAATGTSRQFNATLILSDDTTEDVTRLVKWSTSDNRIGWVDSNGVAHALAEGVITVTATMGDLTDNAQLRIVPILLSELQVQPTSTEMVEATSRQFTATGIFNDGSQQDLTGSVTWATSNSNVVTIGAEGLATALNPGTATISASFDGHSDTAIVEVAEAELTAVQMDPVSASIADGTDQQFVLTAIFNNGSTHDVTPNATWESSNTAVATVGGSGRATGVDPGEAIITASFHGESASAELTVTDAVLERVEVSPTNAELPLGLSQQYTATAVFTDDSTQDVTTNAVWATSNRNRADISNATGSKGKAVGRAVGEVTISAAYGGMNGDTQLTVTDAVITGINVEPPDSRLANGFQRQFTATGLFSDGSNLDITGEVTWTSTDASLAQPSNADGSRGMVTADATNTGELSIEAALDGEKGSARLVVTNATLDAISVSPINASTPLGVQVQYQAEGEFSDGSRLPFTKRSTWSSSNTGIATIRNDAGNEGLATPVAKGATTIKASFGGKEGSTNLTVTDAALVSIEVAPLNASLPVGLTQQYQAVGTYTDDSTNDITGTVTWESSDSDVASIDNGASRGLATAEAEGTTGITATQGGVDSNIATLIVTAAELVSLDVTPKDQSVAAGRELDYNATGSFTDSSSRDLTAEVTWDSSDGGVAQVSNADGSEGKADTFEAGNVTVTATLDGVSGDTGLTVTAAVVDKVDVAPVDPSVPKNEDIQFTATATYSDDSTQDVTGQTDTAWSSSNTTVAQMDAGQKGRAVAHEIGTSIITAQLDGVAGTSELTVTDAVITSIVVTPASPVLPLGYTLRFTATAHRSDGSSEDVTGDVTWGSFNEAVVMVSNASGQRGQAEGLGTGSTTVTATLGGVTGSTQITVETAVLETIDVTPKDERRTVAQTGSVIQYTATGQFDTGTTLDITGQVDWSSSNGNVATISNAAGSKGRATTRPSPGTTTIQATRGGVNDSTTLTVTLF